MKILLIHLKGFLSIAQNLEPRYDDFVATAAILGYSFLELEK